MNGILQCFNEIFLGQSDMYLSIFVVVVGTVTLVFSKKVYFKENVYFILCLAHLKVCINIYVTELMWQKQM